MNIDKIRTNLKTIIFTIIIFVILALVIFFINRLLFKNYVYSSKLLFISSEPGTKLTDEDYEKFKEQLEDIKLINNIISDIENDYNIKFSEKDFHNAITVSKKDSYILLKAKANNPNLAKSLISKTIIYYTTLTNNQNYYPIEVNLNETLPLKDVIITNTYLGTFIGILIVLSKNKKIREIDKND